MAIGDPIQGFGDHLVIALDIVGTRQEFPQRHPFTRAADHVAELIQGGSAQDVIVFLVPCAQFVVLQAVQPAQGFAGVAFVQIDAAQQQHEAIHVGIAEFLLPDDASHTSGGGVVAGFQRGVRGLEPVMIGGAGGFGQLLVTRHGAGEIAGIQHGLGLGIGGRGGHRGHARQQALATRQAPCPQYQW